LGRAHRREVLGVREEHRPGIADPVVEADVSLGRLCLEVGCGLTNRQCHVASLSGCRRKIVAQLGTTPKASPEVPDPLIHVQPAHTPSRSSWWEEGLKAARLAIRPSALSRASSTSAGRLKSFMPPQVEQTRWWWWCSVSSWARSNRAKSPLATTRCMRPAVSRPARHL